LLLTPVFLPPKTFWLERRPRCPQKLSQNRGPPPAFGKIYVLSSTFRFREKTPFFLASLLQRTTFSSSPGPPPFYGGLGCGVLPHWPFSRKRSRWENLPRPKPRPHPPRPPPPRPPFPPGKIGGHEGLNLSFLSGRKASPTNPPPPVPPLARRGQQPLLAPPRHAPPPSSSPPQPRESFPRRNFFFPPPPPAPPGVRPQGGKSPKPPQAPAALGKRRPPPKIVGPPDRCPQAPCRAPPENPPRPPPPRPPFCWFAPSPPYWPTSCSPPPPATNISGFFFCFFVCFFVFRRFFGPFLPERSLEREAADPSPPKHRRVKMNLFPRGNEKAAGTGVSRPPRKNPANLTRPHPLWKKPPGGHAGGSKPPARRFPTTPWCSISRHPSKGPPPPPPRPAPPSKKTPVPLELTHRLVVSFRPAPPSKLFCFPPRGGPQSPPPIPPGSQPRTGPGKMNLPDQAKINFSLCESLPPRPPFFPTPDPKVNGFVRFFFWWRPAGGPFFSFFLPPSSRSPRVRRYYPPEARGVKAIPRTPPHRPP